MSCHPSAPCTPDQVDLMFRESEQYVDQEISDMTCQMGRPLVDMFPVRPWIEGVGLKLSKVRLYTDPGPGVTEDGFEGWRKVEVSRTAEESSLKGPHNACGFDPQEVGFGMEEVQYDLLARDLATKRICVNDIRTFWQYQEVQNIIFKNLTNITANIRESFNREAICSFTVKHLALPGLPGNKACPTALPTNIPSGTKIGKLTYSLLNAIYPYLAQEQGCSALTQIAGAPGFGVQAHPETIRNMIYDDPEIRKDFRECAGKSCDLINKYSLIDTMGQFVMMPDMQAKRYDRDELGNLYRVFPQERNVPIEIGERPITNTAYHNAEFELVQILVNDMFGLRSRSPMSSVGGGTSFGGEGRMGEWKWSNIETICDPFKRTGRYISTFELGIEPGDAPLSMGFLVERKPFNNAIQFWGPADCPVDEIDCAQELAPDACPCPVKVAHCDTALEDELLFTFAPEPGVAVGDLVELTLDNGGCIEVEVTVVNGPKVQVKFPNPVLPADCDCVVGIKCAQELCCSADVEGCDTCRQGSDLIGLTLSKAISAAVGDLITITFGNGEIADVAIAEIESSKFKYWIDLTFQDFCEKKGVGSVCVPPATNPDCPECNPEPEKCEGEKGGIVKKASKANSKKSSASPDVEAPVAKPAKASK